MLSPARGAYNRITVSVSLGDGHAIKLTLCYQKLFVVYSVAVEQDGPSTFRSAVLFVSRDRPVLTVDHLSPEEVRYYKPILAMLMLCSKLEPLG